MFFELETRINEEEEMVILTACFSHFQTLLMGSRYKRSTFILLLEVGFADLKFIVDFKNCGETDVLRAQLLEYLLKTVDQVEIQDLDKVTDVEKVEMNDNNNSIVDVKVLDGHILQDESEKERILSRYKSDRFASQLKRKLSDDFTCEEKKFCIKTEKVDETSDSNDIPQYHTLQPASCITVATSTEDEKDVKPNTGITLPVVILGNGQSYPVALTSALPYQIQSYQRAERILMTCPASIISSSGASLTTLQAQPSLLIHQNALQQHSTSTATSGVDDEKVREVELMSETQPAGPTATPVHIHSVDIPQHSPALRETTVDTSSVQTEDVKVKFETLRTMDQANDSVDMDSHISEHSMSNDDHTMMVTPELLGFLPSGSSAPPSEAGSDNGKGGAKKEWTQEDMDAALDALRNHHMSLSKASTTYGIPSTTLWQRAHKIGIDTPKKEGPARAWNEEILNEALEALRSGSISANKASKAYGIPSSTLYKIAKREGIRLAAPFNAAPTTWTQDDLEKALDAIRSGQTSVQKAATEFGIPTGTLYGRCKREKIELSRSNPAPWSRDMMTEALESIRLGHMSINQASIHYNLPYSSLYGRVRRGKFDIEQPDHDDDSSSNTDLPSGSAHQSMMQHIEVQQLQGVSHSQEQQLQHHHHLQHQQQQQQQQQQQHSTMQPQIMFLQYQHAPATHIQMYHPAAPS